MSKMHLRPGLRPRRPRWGSSHRSPGLLVGFKGPTSKSGEGRGRAGEGHGRERKGLERKWEIGHTGILLFPTSCPGCK